MLLMFRYSLLYFTSGHQLELYVLLADNGVYTAYAK